jgi:pyruvate dehydrogenase complex dehydrogenase (E1) component
VTTSPDVTISTNLGSWVNRRGVFDRHDRGDVHSKADVASPQKWTVSPQGQHIELGIAESSMFSLLGALGLSGPLFGARLLPIGTVYDPFINRGLDALNYACYQDARFILVGTPSGVSLAPEGGAHQSVYTPLIGRGQPNLTMFDARRQILEDIPEAGLLVVTSPDRLHAGWIQSQRANRVGETEPSHIERLLRPLSRTAGLVTILDGHAAALSWVGAARSHRVIPLGVERFGQSGDIPGPLSRAWTRRRRHPERGREVVLRPRLLSHDDHRGSPSAVHSRREWRSSRGSISTRWRSSRKGPSQKPEWRPRCAGDLVRPRRRGRSDGHRGARAL